MSAERNVKQAPRKLGCDTPSPDRQSFKDNRTVTLVYLDFSHNYVDLFVTKSDGTTTKRTQRRGFVIILTNNIFDKNKESNI